LNGWPITQRSGCLHFALTRLMRSPDELVAITVSGGTAASSVENNSTLRSSRSGPFSCTNSAPFVAATGSLKNSKRLRSASGRTALSFSNVGQALSMKRRAKLSPSGAGS
jgi:hypothetical protein